MICAGFGALIALKLMQLQIVQGSDWRDRAEQSHLGYSEVTARRGDILIRDPNSNELFRLATNISQPTLFADPTLVKDPQFLVEKLAVMIFDKEREVKKEENRIRILKRNIAADVSPEEQNLVLGAVVTPLTPPPAPVIPTVSTSSTTNTLAIGTNAASNTPATAPVTPPKIPSDISLKPRSEEELFLAYKTDLLQKLSQKTRSSILLYKDPPQGIIDFLNKNKITGIQLEEDGVVAYPAQITDQDYTAKVLAPIIEIPYERLKELLVGRNRYVVLQTRVSNDTEQKIRTMIKKDKEAKTELWSGVNFQDHTYRYYPEGQLAAQVVGFTSDKSGGVYGIEQSADLTLRGKKGIFKTRLDATGQQVIVGDDLIIEPAIDGDSVVLTIDRSIQLTVEKYLEKTVKETRADSGLVIIMEPKTGRVISMAHYPTFDPNKYGEALETEDIALTPDELKRVTTTINNRGEEINFLNIDYDTQYKIQIFKTIVGAGKVIYSKYRNILGPEVFKNRSVTDIWEPGSIFKAIVMSMAIDDGDVQPTTTYNDNGPLKVDEFEIHNALNTYYGITNMRQVLERSLNTGMAFVARKMGRELFGRYIKKFGFGEKTEIEFENEHQGQVKDYNRWAESELITHAFGQGIAITPIQMITAMSTIANGGILMKPQIIHQVIKSNGEETTMDPVEVRRVITEKTASTVAAMMVSVVENGGAARVFTPGYHIAGKTGTAQTYKDGKPLSGLGTTIGSFIGFAPVEDPKFVMLVKIDRPRSSYWADATAAPLFKNISDFLFKYYNIPPSESAPRTIQPRPALPND